MKYNNQQLRHELKYYINAHEYAYIKKRFIGSLDRDDNCINNDNYNVKSLYFDDVYNSAYREKQISIDNRKKFRIRIYNDNKNLIKLEKKSKIDNYTSKEVHEITCDDYYKILQGDNSFLLDSSYKLLREFYIECITKLLKPKIIVEYDREAYVCQAGNVRITFDNNLSASSSHDILNNKIITKRIFNKPIVIMEVKYDSFLPSYVRNLIQLCNHDISAISKYTICRKEIDNCI
jgi:hypothetical protein